MLKIWLTLAILFMPEPESAIYIQDHYLYTFKIEKY